MRAKLTAVLLALAFAVTGLVTAGSASATTHHPTKVIADCQHAHRKPHSIVIACGDGNVTATRLTYTSWGPKAAHGRGRIVANDCTPSCVSGHDHSYPMRFTLTRPRSTSAGRVFSRLAVTYLHKSPTGKKHESYSLVTTPL